METLLEAVNTLEYYIEPLLTKFERMMYKIVNTADPITVSIFLFIILSPFALTYIIIARIAMIKLG